MTNKYNVSLAIKEKNNKKNSIKYINIKIIFIYFISVFYIMTIHFKIYIWN